MTYKNPLQNLPFGPTLRYSKCKNPYLRALNCIFEILKSLDLNQKSSFAKGSVSR